LDCSAASGTGGASAGCGSAQHSRHRRCRARGAAAAHPAARLPKLPFKTGWWLGFCIGIS